MYTNKLVELEAKNFIMNSSNLIKQYESQIYNQQFIIFILSLTTLASWLSLIYLIYFSSVSVKKQEQLQTET